MSKYTYTDVIIDPEDPRVEIGEKYFFFDFPVIALKALNGEAIPIISSPLGGIEERDIQPFKTADNTSYTCIIRKKEPGKTYVPFDLSDPEVRKGLRGKVITAKDTPFSRYIEAVIGCFELRDTKVDSVDCQCWFMNGISAEELMNDWKFEDGSPVGKLVEEE